MLGRFRSSNYVTISIVCITCNRLAIYIVVNFTKSIKKLSYR